MQDEDKCPKCGGKIYLVQLSTGGDDILLCSKCDWVESCAGRG